MTGLRGDQVAELVTAVFGLLGRVWQPVKGRRPVLGLHPAVVLTLFLIRRNDSQAAAGELFGCSRRRCPGSCAGAINSTRAAVERAVAHLVDWKVLDTGWRGRLTEFLRATTHRQRAGDLPNLG